MGRIHVVTIDGIDIVTDQIVGGGFVAYRADLDPIVFGHGFNRDEAMFDLLDRLKGNIDDDSQRIA